MYVCMQLCIIIFMYVCMYVCMCLCMYVFMYVCMYICMCVCIYLYMYVCICVCMYLCNIVYTCVHSYMHLLNNVFWTNLSLVYLSNSFNPKRIHNNIHIHQHTPGPSETLLFHSSLKSFCPATSAYHQYGSYFSSSY